MNFFRSFILFLLFAIAAAAITSLVLPARQHVERTTTINAQASVIYQQLIKLENINKWLVWNQQDSAIKIIITGTDGTVGATSSWTGSPELSGEGKMTLVSLESNRKVNHHLSFIKPRKGSAESVFSLQEANGQTKVTWAFDMATPRPWNIFNLFYSMDKKMGKDFETGLAALKLAIENTRVQ
jgi:hypothetical protein